MHHFLMAEAESGKLGEKDPESGVQDKVVRSFARSLERSHQGLSRSRFSARVASSQVYGRSEREREREEPQGLL